jgi:hypothetical protein
MPADTPFLELLTEEVLQEVIRRLPKELKAYETAVAWRYLSTCSRKLCALVSNMVGAAKVSQR